MRVGGRRSCHGRRAVNKPAAGGSGTAGSGPTSRTIGIVRLHYSYEPLIQLAVRGLQFFEHFEAHTGATADFIRTGSRLRTTALRLPPLSRAVQIEVPRCGRRDWRETYTAIIADFLAQAVALPVGR